MKKAKAIPNATQISAQIDGLMAIQPKVLRTSMFGDDHHAAIDAQIEVLQEDLDEDEIYKRWGGAGEEGEEDVGQNVVNAAVDARHWLDGDFEDAPDLIESWKELVR